MGLDLLGTIVLLVVSFNARSIFDSSWLSNWSWIRFSNGFLSLSDRLSLGLGFSRFCDGNRVIFANLFTLDNSCITQSSSRVLMSFLGCAFFLCFLVLLLGLLSGGFWHFISLLFILLFFSIGRLFLRLLLLLQFFFLDLGSCAACWQVILLLNRSFFDDLLEDLELRMRVSITILVNDFMCALVLPSFVLVTEPGSSCLLSIFIRLESRPFMLDPLFLRNLSSNWLCL